MKMASQNETDQPREKSSDFINQSLEVQANFEEEKQLSMVIDKKNAYIKSLNKVKEQALDAKSQYPSHPTEQEIPRTYAIKRKNTHPLEEDPTHAIKQQSPFVELNQNFESKILNPNVYLDSECENRFPKDLIVENTITNQDQPAREFQNTIETTSSNFQTSVQNPNDQKYNMFHPSLKDSKKHEKELKKHALDNPIQENAKHAEKELSNNLTGNFIQINTREAEDKRIKTNYATFDHRYQYEQNYEENIQRPKDREYYDHHNERNFYEFDSRNQSYAKNHLDGSQINYQNPQKNKYEVDEDSEIRIYETGIKRTTSIKKEEEPIAIYRPNIGRKEDVKQVRREKQEVSLDQDSSIKKNLSINPEIVKPILPFKKLPTHVENIEINHNYGDSFKSQTGMMDLLEDINNIGLEDVEIRPRIATANKNKRNHDISEETKPNFRATMSSFSTNVSKNEINYDREETKANFNPTIFEKNNTKIQQNIDNRQGLTQQHAIKTENRGSKNSKNKHLDEEASHDQPLKDKSSAQHESQKKESLIRNNFRLANHSFDVANQEEKPSFNFSNQKTSVHKPNISFNIKPNSFTFKGHTSYQEKTNNQPKRDEVNDWDWD